MNILERNNILNVGDKIERRKLICWPSSKYLSHITAASSWFAMEIKVIIFHTSQYFLVDSTYCFVINLLAFEPLKF